MNQQYRIIKYLMKIELEEVFLAIDPISNKTVCVKIVKAKDRQQLDAIINEANSLKSVQQHPKAIKLLNHYSEKLSSSQGYNLHLIMKYYSKGDLDEELEKRCKSRNYYSKQELIKNFYEFILLFKHLQAGKICHRDIKPKNIYITKTNKLKIGDFGDAKMEIDFENSHTIKGTPNYISPKLKIAYRAHLKGEKDNMAIHNPYKSDVYSLGLVFLYMSTLEQIDQRFNVLENVANTIREILTQIPSKNLRELIAKMLEFEEENRPDFINLYEYIKKFVCTKCWNECEDQNKCLFCKSVYHYHCLENLTCSVCFKSMSCTGCGRLCIQESLCNSHSYCGECRLKNFTCSLCCCVQYLKLDEVELFTVPVSRASKCENCFANLEIKTIQCRNICKNCQNSYCGVCKAKQHISLCLDTEDITKRVLCKCGRFSEVRVDELFMVCKFNCRYNGFCIVCYREALEFSHATCVALLYSKVLAGVILSSDENSASVKAENKEIYNLELENGPIDVHSHVLIRLLESNKCAIYMGRFRE